jgi:hypothetical protein
MVQYEVNNYPEGMTLELCTPEEIDEHIQRLMEQLNNKDRDARRKAAEALSDYVAGNYIPEDASPHPAAILVEGLKERDRDARIGSAMSLARMATRHVFPIRLVMPEREGEWVLGPRKTKLAKLRDITKVRLEPVELAYGDHLLEISGGPIERRMKVVSQAVTDVVELWRRRPNWRGQLQLSSGILHGQTNFLVPIEQFDFLMTEDDLQDIAAKTNTQVLLDTRQILLGSGDPDKFFVVSCTGELEGRLAALQHVHERLEPDPGGQSILVAGYSASALAMAASHRDKEFRVEVCKALGVLGPVAANDSAESLAAQLTDPEGSVRSEVLKALALMGAAAAGVAQAVGAALVDQDPDVRRMAALTLREFGPDAAPAAASHLAYAIRPLTERNAAKPNEGPHREIRILAVEALLAMGEAAAADAAEALARILREDPCDDMLRYAALRALGNMGAGAAPQVRRIACALQQDPVDFVRETAKETLVLIGCPDARNGAMSIGEAKDLIARAPEVVAAAKAEAEAKIRAEAEALAEAQRAAEAAKAEEEFALIEKESFDLVFEDVDFSKVDVEAFRASLPFAFQELGAKEEDFQMVKFSLPEGNSTGMSSHIVEVVGPVSIIKSVRELPLSNIKVLGFAGYVFGEKPKETKKGLGRKGARKAQAATADDASATAADTAPKEVPAETSSTVAAASVDSQPATDLGMPLPPPDTPLPPPDAVPANVAPVELEAAAPASPRDQRIFQSRRRGIDVTHPN